MTTSPRPTDSGRSRLRRWLGTCAVLGLLAVIVVRRDDFALALRAADPARLLLPLPVAVLFTLLSPTAWHLILRGLGTALPWPRTAEIWLVAGMARFVPGAIWPFAARIALSREAGVAPRTASVSLYLETLLTAITSLLIGLPALLHRYPSVAPLVPLLFAVPIALLHPRVLTRLLRVLRAEPDLIESLATTGLRPLLAPAAFYCIYWVCWGALFAAFATAFQPLALGDAPYVVSSFALAYCIGFVAPIFPAGLGLREGALYALLLAVYPAGIALTVAVTFRLWMLCGELPALLAGSWLGHRHRRQTIAA